MKKSVAVLMAISFLLASTAPSFASDWDKAGKAFAVIEGLRVLTGGRLDVIGSMTGIKSGAHVPVSYSHPRHKKMHRERHCWERVWVPHYVWVEEYVPRHKTYDPKYGNIIVEARYVSRRVEKGGHWETQDFCRYN